MTTEEGKGWWGAAFATSWVALHFQKSSMPCCPAANNCNGASSVHLVITTRIGIYLKKKYEK